MIWQLYRKDIHRSSGAHDTTARVICRHGSVDKAHRCSRYIWCMERNWGCNRCSMATNQGHVLAVDITLGLDILGLHLGLAYHLIVCHPIRSLQQSCYECCSIIISMDFLVRQSLYSWLGVHFSTDAILATVANCQRLVWKHFVWYPITWLHLHWGSCRCNHYQCWVWSAFKSFSCHTELNWGCLLCWYQWTWHDWFVSGWYVDFHKQYFLTEHI